MSKQAEKQRKKATKQLGHKKTKGGKKQREPKAVSGKAAASAPLTEQLTIAHSAVREADAILRPQPDVAAVGDTVDVLPFCVNLDNGLVTAGSYELTVEPPMTIEQARSKVSRIARKRGIPYSSQKRKDNLIVRVG